MDRPSQRYKALVEELGRELKHRHGWKAEVSRRLGVNASMITRVVNEERPEISADSVRLAVEGVGVSPMFFFDEEDPGSYRDHQDALAGLFPTKAERDLLDVLESAQALFGVYIAKGKLPVQAADLAARVLAIDFVEKARAVVSAPATASAHRTVELVKALGGMSVSLRSLQHAAQLERVAEEEAERLG